MGCKEDCPNQGQCCRELLDGHFVLECIDEVEREVNVIDGVCEYLDENGECTIYDRRPKVCADWVCPYI